MAARAVERVPAEGRDIGWPPSPRPPPPPRDPDTPTPRPNRTALRDWDEASPLSSMCAASSPIASSCRAARADGRRFEQTPLQRFDAQHPLARRFMHGNAPDHPHITHDVVLVPRMHRQLDVIVPLRLGHAALAVAVRLVESPIDRRTNHGRPLAPSSRRESPNPAAAKSATGPPPRTRPRVSKTSSSVPPKIESTTTMPCAKPATCPEWIALSNTRISRMRLLNRYPCRKLVVLDLGGTTTSTSKRCPPSPRPAANSRGPPPGTPPGTPTTSADCARRTTASRRSAHCGATMGRNRHPCRADPFTRRHVLDLEPVSVPAAPCRRQ